MFPNAFKLLPPNNTSPPSEAEEGLSVPRRIRGVKILKAVSSALRLQILNLLFDKGPLSYTELMSSLKMNPSRDAGKFAYHLKFLLKADLIEADVEAKKYCLTDMGKMVIDVADKIEKKAFKQKGILVRTSRFALEEFDTNKIANSLIKEAKMPAELAQKVAKETEKRLLKSKTKYLTAPLIREMVNAILIEKDLEEYRHKLTRLGLPVHEVKALIESKTKTSPSATVQEIAGETVIKEYVLLNVFPRDISDAHLSGAIHVSGLSSWILKPSDVMHDLRFFFQNGLNLEKINAFQPSYSAPKDLESALSLMFNVLLHSCKEADGEQVLDYFNVFLAPFVKGLEPATIKETLSLFISNVGQNINASFGIELTIPDFAANKVAFGPLGKKVGNYGDFAEESQLLASVVLEVFSEKSTIKPFLNPKIIIKIRSETFSNDKAKAMLLEAHRLSLNRGIPYFANLMGEKNRQSVFSASACCLKADLSGDWEIDTLRTGSLGHVTVNLPRIAYECEKDKNKFFGLLRERLEMAARALEIKYAALRQHGKGLLPFLLQGANGDQYFRIENSSSLVNLVGLKEAVEFFCGKNINEDDKALTFAEEITQNVSDFVQRTGKRRRKRLLAAMLPSFEDSERLAQMDIERYGIAKVRFSGTREKPFYSTISKLALSDGKISINSLATQQKLFAKCDGGNMTAIEIGEHEGNPDELTALTRQLSETHAVEFFTYNRKLTYCSNCKRSWVGLLPKCPSCGATSTLTQFNRN